MATLQADLRQYENNAQGRRAARAFHHEDAHAGFETYCPFCNELNWHDWITIYLNNGKPYPYNEAYDEKHQYCEHMIEFYWDGSQTYWFWFGIKKQQTPASQPKEG